MMFDCLFVTACGFSISTQARAFKNVCSIKQLKVDQLDKRSVS